VIVMRIRNALPAALVAGLVVGCGKPAPSSPQTSTAATASVTEPAKVELKEVSAAGFEEAIRGMKGKVVLVDSWFLG
jgi:hypothetical protein